MFFKILILTMPIFLSISCGNNESGSESKSVLVRNLWPNGEVFFDLDPSLSAGERNMSMAAINHWREWSNLRFTERNNDTANFVRFNRVEGSCSSSLGRVGGTQLIDCDFAKFSQGSLIHEIGHAIGMVHEQQRSDRDEYINIDWDNIPERFRTSDYSISSNSQIRSGYDFYSIMHYPSFIGSNVVDEKIPVLKKLSGRTVSANRTSLSPGDMQGVFQAYGGSGISPGVQRWLDTHRPALIVGDVRENIGNYYAVFDRSQSIPWDTGDRQATPLGHQFWGVCPINYVFVGNVAGENGFWVCGRNDIVNKGQEFYLGDTSHNLGNYYLIKLNGNGAITSLGHRHWGTCEGGTQVAALDFTPNGFWACSIKPRGPESTGIYIGLVRKDMGTLYQIDTAGNFNALKLAHWNECPASSVRIETLFESNGFWLCVPPDLQESAFYVGNVVANHGRLYKLRKGSLKLRGDAFWDSCPSAQFLGHLFNPDGAWVCK